jgi:hypothetical protein
MPNGKGLASARSYMALNQPDEFGSLQSQLRSVIPSVQRIRFDRAPINVSEPETIKINNEELLTYNKIKYSGEVILFDMKGTSGLPAQLISEGTLLESVP